MIFDRRSSKEVAPEAEKKDPVPESGPAPGSTRRGITRDDPSDQRSIPTRLMPSVAPEAFAPTSLYERDESGHLSELASSQPPSTRQRAVPGAKIRERYKLIRQLGEGGMAVVWRAKDLVLNIDVALKLIPREMLTPESTERLFAEAQAAARLAHPNAVRVIDVGTSDDGDAYLVMELLKGVLLSRRLRLRGPMAPVDAVALVLPLCRALAAAHDVGVIHRDLKPSNVILVQEDGIEVPTLIDFGVAKLTRSSKESRLTSPGMLLGSPDYMAPEQARGEMDVDARVDVWGLCVVLYELIHGSPPFSSESSLSILVSIQNREPPPPPMLGAGHSLWMLIARGLEKDRKRRWPSMRLLGAALARWALDNGLLQDITGTSLTRPWIRGAETR